MIQHLRPRRSILAPDPFAIIRCPSKSFHEPQNVHLLNSSNNPKSIQNTSVNRKYLPATKPQTMHKRKCSDDSGSCVIPPLIPKPSQRMATQPNQKENFIEKEEDIPTFRIIQPFVGSVSQSNFQSKFVIPNTTKFKSEMQSPEKQFPHKVYSPQKVKKQHSNKYNNITMHCEAVPQLSLKKVTSASDRLPKAPVVSTRRFSHIRSLSLRDFDIGKMLGRGRLGQVFLVRHRHTNFVCALKVIEKAFVKQHGLEDQVIQEIKIQSFLNHPNLVSLYGWFQDKERVYLLLQACLDGALYSQIKDKPIPECQARGITSQICLALEHMHGQNIIHRDLKPQNIVMQYVVAKICDFGWAAVCNGVRNTVCGTPLYLSPELLTGHQYDERTDIWALGIMTYEMLVGEPPFNVRCQEHLVRVLLEEVEFPSGTGISIWAQEFIRKALAKDPGDRLLAKELAMEKFVLREEEWERG